MKILDRWKSEALVDKEQYENLYKESILENDDFWNKQGNRINWIKKYSKIRTWPIYFLDKMKFR